MDQNRRQILVTGGAGFIGSNFVRFALEQRPDWHIVNLDALTYAGNPQNLRDLEGEPRGLRLEKMEFADGRFYKEDGQQIQRLRILWSFSDDGTWRGPRADPR